MKNKNSERMNKKKIKEYLEHAKALENAIRFIYQNDIQNIWRFSSYQTYMRKYNTLVQLVAQGIDVRGLIDLYNIKEIKGPGETPAMIQKNYFDSLLANVILLRSLLETELDVKSNEIDNLKNFLQVNIRKVIFEKPENEYKVQNAVEQLLIGRGFSKGIDYDRETGRVKVSSKEVIPDFIFPKLDLALEVKLCRDKAKLKKIIDEINADIQAYDKKYGNLLFVVYDFGFIRDEAEFKNGLDNVRNISVIIIKH